MGARGFWERAGREAVRLTARSLIGSVCAIEEEVAASQFVDATSVVAPELAWQALVVT